MPNEEGYGYLEGQTDPQLKLLAAYAINLSVVRMREKSESSDMIESNICQATLAGLGKETGIGATIFSQHIKDNTGINTIVGLSDGGTYSQIESGIGGSYFSSYGAVAKSVYSTLTTSALMGSYAASVEATRLNTFLSGAYVHLNGYLNDGPTTGVFTDVDLTTLKSAYDYSGSFGEIFDGSPRNSETNKIYFQYYDLSPSFSDSLNLSLVKDSAIQEYLVSGELTYSPTPWSEIPECNEIEIPVFVNQDKDMIQKYYYASAETYPCIDSYRHIQPITGLEFSRNVVDGPYSTGLWDQSIMDDYINREKSGLSLSQYSSNRKNLQSFYGVNLPSVVNIPPNINTDVSIGEYMTPFTREKNDSPVSNQKTWYHVGNSTGIRTGNYISGYARRGNLFKNALTSDLVEVYRQSGLGNSSTGIKFVPLKLKASSWQSTLGNNAYNPMLASERIYQSALNFNSKHITDFSTQSGIAGPPQRDDLSALPYLSFYQNFDSKVNGTFADITFGFAHSAIEKVEDTPLGYSIFTHNQYMFATTGSGGYSPTFTDAQHYTPDEGLQADVNFSFSVSSKDFSKRNVNGNLVKSRVLGMGNAIDDGIVQTGYRISNGGVIHSGYIHSGIDGIPSHYQYAEATGYGQMGNLVLISGYSGLAAASLSSDITPSTNEHGAVTFGSLTSAGGIIGSLRKYDSILVGWKHPIHGGVKISKMYAYESGDINKEYTYSGFSSGNTFKASPEFPLVSLDAGFAANPRYTGLLASGWVPIIQKQRNELFLPRYWRGPFASAQKKFLYPNAQNLVTGSSLYISPSSSLLTELNEGGHTFHNSTGRPVLIGDYSSGGFNQKVGFPHMVVFDMEVKEYAVKEYYKKTSYNAAQNPSTSFYPGVDPILENVTWNHDEGFQETNTVDDNYAGYATLIGDTFHMGYTGKNPLVYNSPPNYVHGFINDRVGRISGTSSQNPVGVTEWPHELLHDSGAYLVRWRDTLNGSSYGDVQSKNPEGNYYYLKTYTRRVTGIYTPPGYRMADGKFSAEPAYRVWPVAADLGKSAKRPPLYGFPGADPLYYHRVSSITGLESVNITEEIHGGMHPNGLHGDSWMSFSYSGVDIHRPGYTAYDEIVTTYGFGLQSQPSNPHTNLHRKPEKDYLIFLTDMRSTGFGVHFSALTMFPATGRQGTGEYADRYAYYKSGLYTGFAPGTTFDYDNKTFSFTAKVLTGVNYPIPSGNGWSGSGSGANVIWPVPSQWHKEHTGEWLHWRQASKLDITFKNVSWTGYGQPPVDVEYLHLPSGECTIAGNFKYSKMKEAPVFSEGIFLADVTTNDPIRTYGTYPQYVSAVLQEHGDSVTVPLNTELLAAPSRQLELANPEARLIAGDQDFVKVNTIERNFNKYLAMAISDYAYLNAGVMPSYEGSPLPDDQTFPMTMLYSANKGQQFPDNTQNPYVLKEYEVQKQYQYYDGELTDSAEDQRFRTSKFPIWGYQEPSNAQFVPANITLREAEKGLY